MTVGASPARLATPSAPAVGPLAVYLHTPFCPTKCGYCDFNSFAGLESLRERTVRAIIREIARSPLRGRPAKTVYFGGGTPTVLSAAQLERLLASVVAAHPPVEGCEITSEANPGTVDVSKFDAMRRMGFNRISLGAQSFKDADLARLGRVHRSAEIASAVQAARKAGFENLNLDLMFALPEQTVADWRANLLRAIGLGPEHLSLYCLTLEPNTPFYKQHLRGRLTQPDDEVQVEMYDLAVDLAGRSGYSQYEISNFARPGYACRHNLAYWRCDEYAGYGPGAVGCAMGLKNPPVGEPVELLSSRLADAPLSLASQPSCPRIRYTNLKHPGRYCDAVENGRETWCESEELNPVTERMERIMLGLRLNEGLPLSALDQEQWAEDPEVGARQDLSSRIRCCQSKGWVEVRDGRLFLTPKGRHWCSQVALELI